MRNSLQIQNGLDQMNGKLIFERQRRKIYESRHLPDFSIHVVDELDNSCCGMQFENEPRFIYLFGLGHKYNRPNNSLPYRASKREDMKTKLKIAERIILGEGYPEIVYAGCDHEPDSYCYCSGSPHGIGLSDGVDLPKRLLDKKIRLIAEIIED